MDIDQNKNRPAVLTKVKTLTGLRVKTLVFVAALGIIGFTAGSVILRSSDFSSKEVLDYNNDKKLNYDDWDVLSGIINSRQVCPENKVCDINQDGKLNEKDIEKIVRIIQGADPVPDF